MCVHVHVSLCGCKWVCVSANWWTYKWTRRVVVAAANVLGIGLLVSQRSLRHRLQIGRVGLRQIAGGCHMRTPGGATTKRERGRHSYSCLCVCVCVCAATYRCTAMTKLLPERTTTSCASLWRKLKTSTSLILMTASPGCRPACSDRLPALTCKKEEETETRLQCVREQETTLRSNRATIGNGKSNSICTRKGA